MASLSWATSWRQFISKHFGTRRADQRRRPQRRPRLELLEDRTVPDAGTWAAVAAAPSSGGLGTMLLLPNGTVMVEGGGETNAWYQLTPNATGSYAAGTWTQLASMNVSRLYFASDVLPSGNVFVEGGEYASDQSFSNSGEIYNPSSNTWRTIATFPQSNFGDDPSSVLQNGTILCGYISGPQTYFYNPAADAWSQAASKLNNDQSDEEGWVELPNGDVLSYNVFASIDSGLSSAQYYNPSNNTWTATSTFSTLLSSSAYGAELGPGLLMPQNGNVIYLGGNNNTAIYNPTTNSWTAGPVIPNKMACDDAPGAVLPTGQIIFAADAGTTGSQGLFNPPSALYLYDPTSNTMSSVTSVPSALAGILTKDPSFVDRMLVLPNGQLLFGDSTNTLYVYTPGGTIPSSWQPTISSITGSGLGPYTLTGTQLNGLDEGATYGDDVQMNENYPIVQLTSASGNVYYATTLNWSSEGVQTGSTPVTTNFTLPSTLPAGTYALTVIADGIASSGQIFTYGTGFTSTTTALVSSANPSVIGQPVTFTATVSPASGNGTPTGTVIFQNGTATLGTATLAGGSASFTTHSLALGTATIRADYYGDTNFFGSPSGPLSQTVNKDASSTTLTSSASPSVYGEAVTFTATVAGAAPGSGSGTGIVTFKSGFRVLGTSTLIGGSAGLSVASFQVGSHSVTAVYGGDGNFTAGTSPALTQTVIKDSTTTKVVSSANPSTSGQSVTFTATVNANVPGNFTPGGSVLFRDGSATLGIEMLSKGMATFTTSALTVGKHYITAEYLGGTNFNAGISTFLTQTVKAGPAFADVSSSSLTARSTGIASSGSTGTFEPASDLGVGTTFERGADWTAFLVEMAGIVNAKPTVPANAVFVRIGSRPESSETWTDPSREALDLLFASAASHD